MIQLPAGASDSIPGQGRDFGRGWRPGGAPGIQTRHSPSSGRCPGGTPNVAAVLGPRFVSASRTSGLGPRTTVLVERVQAPAASRAARPETSTTPRIGPPPKMVGPNVVFPAVSVGSELLAAAVLPSVQILSRGYPAPTHGRAANRRCCAGRPRSAGHETSRSRASLKLSFHSPFRPVSFDYLGVLAPYRLGADMVAVAQLFRAPDWGTETHEREHEVMLPLRASSTLD